MLVFHQHPEPRQSAEGATSRPALHVKVLLPRAKLPPIRFHDLRHTFATLQVAAGTNPKFVSEALGHKDIAITLDRYSHVLPTLQAKTMLRLDAILGRGDDAQPVAGRDKGSRQRSGATTGAIRTQIASMDEVGTAYRGPK